MDTHTYAIEHEVEKTHWWFQGRRYLFRKVINKLNLSKSARIMDVGSSSGTNLRLLKSMGFSNYHGLDVSKEAQKFCEEKGLGKVYIADVQKDALTENHYDLILLTDVLEHLQEDGETISRMHKYLKDAGYLLITVPCFQSLWGPQDIVAHHLRRYKKSHIKQMLKNRSFEIITDYHFNFLLFLPIWLMRKILLKTKSIQNENELNTPFINFILKLLFRLDCWLAPHLLPPFGVSALILARKI